MKKFEVGKTYNTQSSTSDWWYSYTVVKRTKCTVTLFDEFYGIEKRRKIKEYNGSEIVYPEGKYSMCPTLNAGRDENRLERETKQNNIISIYEWKNREAM